MKHIKHVSVVKAEHCDINDILGALQSLSTGTTSEAVDCISGLVMMLIAGEKPSKDQFTSD